MPRRQRKLRRRVQRWDSEHLSPIAWRNEDFSCFKQTRPPDVSAIAINYDRVVSIVGEVIRIALPHPLIEKLATFSIMLCMRSFTSLQRRPDGLLSA